MITEALMSFFFALVDLVVGWLPTSGPPAFFATSAGYVAQIWGYGGQLGSWIPWNLAGICVSAVLASILAGFGIKVVRLLISLFTGGGGSAA